MRAPASGARARPANSQVLRTSRAAKTKARMGGLTGPSPSRPIGTGCRRRLGTSTSPSPRRSPATSVLGGGTGPPRSPDLVRHVVLDLVGDIGDGLVVVEREGVAGDRQAPMRHLHRRPHRPRHPLRRRAMNRILSVLEDPVVISEDCAALAHGRRRLDIADHEVQRRPGSTDRLLALGARLVSAPAPEPSRLPSPRRKTPLDLFGFEPAHTEMPCVSCRPGDQGQTCWSPAAAIM